MTRVRIAKYRCYLYFNHRCKENYVLPSSLRFRPPLRSAKGYKLMVRTGFSFLKLRIDECHSSILRLRILSRKNNEPTPFILFLAMTVITNTSDRPNVSLVHG